MNRAADRSPPGAGGVRERRRRTGLIVTLASGLLALVLGASIGSSSGGGGAETTERPGPIELPRGGRSLLPEYRLVGFYGAPQDEALGALGIGTPAEAGQRLMEQAKAYEDGKPVMPVFELIATIVVGLARQGELYRNRQPHSVIQEYLTETRRNRGILLLDIQPGRAGFAGEVRRLERYLDEPDVGLALDPEWNVGPDEIPGEVIGFGERVRGQPDRRGAGGNCRAAGPARKAPVIHQFTDEMITAKALLEPQDGLATVLNVDGFGDPLNKIAKNGSSIGEACDGPRVGAEELLRRGPGIHVPGGRVRPQAGAGPGRLRVTRAGPEAR